MKPGNYSIFAHLRDGFFAGVAVLLPLVVTIFVVHFLVANVGAPAGSVIFQNLFERYPEENTPVWYAINGAATLAVFFLITAAGVFSKYVIGSYFLKLGEQIIQAVPLINTVYGTVKQIVESFSKQQNSLFNKVVLIEYPRKGIYSLGFLTNEIQGEVGQKTGQRIANVFIPTVPNPMTGFLVLIEESEIRTLDMSVGDAIKMLVSGGSVTPETQNRFAVQKASEVKVHKT